MKLRRLVWLGGSISLLGVAALTSCGPDPIITPVRNLERPSDMDFVCMEVVNVPAEGMTPARRVATGRPMSECHKPEVQDPRPGNQLLRTFGLVTGSARSELGALVIEAERLVDLDPNIPGFNQLPVGALPESVSASDDGCRAVTANRGSCDLSLVNTSRALSPALGAAAPMGEEAEPLVSQIRVRTGSGEELRVAPYEVAFVPRKYVPPPFVPMDAPPPPRPPMCSAEGQWRAVVTFPSCDLVALVNLPSGTIQSSVRILADGSVLDTGTNPVCPVDCRADSGTVDAGASDATALEAGMAGDGAALVDARPGEVGTSGDVSADQVGTDAGAVDAATVPPPAAVTGPLGVGAVAVMPNGDLAYVGAARSPNITALGIGPTGFFQPSSGARIPLAEQPGGVTRLRLSVNPYGVRNEQNEYMPFVGSRGRFLYAVARDGSIRVVDISRGVVPAECDVNVDYQRVAAPDLERMRSCVPVSEQKPRLLLESGPGIRVPVRLNPDVAPPVPVDIAFAEIGQFATGLLLSSNGVVYHIVLDAPATGGFTEIHVPRRVDPNTPGSLGGGDPRIESEPERGFNETPVAFPTRVGFASPLLGPRFESRSRTADAMGTAVTEWMKFSRGAPPEEVVVRWEGILPGTYRLTGKLEPTAQAGAAGVLRDVGADYCQASVVAGDVVGVSGCSQDQECDPQRNEVCFRVSPGAQGTCLPRTFVNDEALVRSCQSELASRRRYEVLEVRKRELVLGLKLDEVPRPRISACQPGVNSNGPGAIVTPLTGLDVCQPDATHAPDPTVEGDQGFRCLAWAPDENRCLKQCGVRDSAGRWQLNDKLCRAGHVCADVGHESLGPLCVEAPAPRPECTPGETRYQVQAGKSYVVASQAVPNVITHREEPGGEPARGGRCLPIPGLHPLFSQRIPLSAPQCQRLLSSDTALVLDHALESEPPGHNPCLFIAPNTGQNLDPSERANPNPPLHVKALFQNPHYTFVMSNLESYVGDAATLRAYVRGGFSPMRVTTTGNTVIGLGARILTGPMDAEQQRNESLVTDRPGAAFPPYFFVIDQGRTLTQFSRGQILRINPRPLENLTGGFIDSIESGALFPIQ